MLPAKLPMMFILLKILDLLLYLSIFPNYKFFDLVLAGETLPALAAACFGGPIAPVRIAAVKLLSVKFLRIPHSFPTESEVTAEIFYRRLRNSA